MNLTFIKLSEANSKPVEILRTGTFTDMHGQTVTITTADLDAFVKNFNAGSAGQDIPIDLQHEKREAGGWLKSLKRVGNKLLGWIEWNELGRDLVSKKIFRYLSASINRAKNTISSISLVNFPAVKGLQPVELSENVYSFKERIMKRKMFNFAEGEPATVGDFLQAANLDALRAMADDMVKAGEMTADDRAALETVFLDAVKALVEKLGELAGKQVPGQAEPAEEEAPESPPDTAQMSEAQLRAKFRAEFELEQQRKAKETIILREQVKAEVEKEFKAKFEKRQALLEFANEVCSGANALQAKPAEVVDMLELLPDDKLEAAKKMLKAKNIDLSERGSEGDANRKEKLPAAARADVLKGDLTINELFKAHVLPGKPDDYDLSEFSTEQKGF